MKTPLLVLLAAAALVSISFTSCNKDDNKGQLDPDAMISIRPAAGVKAETNPKHLTAKQIVEQATDIWYWNRAINTTNALGRGFAPSQRDLANLRLLMFGTDIIWNGKYMPNFIEGEDVILTKANYPAPMDTVAYIPNKDLRAAQKVIKEAYDNGDYTTVYAEFDRAFTFTPITGAEWLELKAQGKN